MLASGGAGVTWVPTVVTSFLYPTGEGSRHLLDAKVKLIANTLCNSHRLYDHMIDDSMICAGNLQKPGKDSCQVRGSKWHLEKETWVGACTGQRPDWEPRAGRMVQRPTCHKAEAQAGIPVLWQVGTHIHPGRSSTVTRVATWPTLSNLILMTLVKGISSSPDHRYFEKLSWLIHLGSFTLT